MITTVDQILTAGKHRDVDRYCTLSLDQATSYDASSLVLDKARGIWKPGARRSGILREGSWMTEISRG